MATGDTSSVLRRKAQSGRDVHQARAMSIARALRLTVAKLADQMFDMAMSVIGVAREVVDGGAIGAICAEPALLILLDGPDRRTGAAILDPALVGGLIQQQTMGTVIPVQEAVPPRKMTMTDASLCAPFLDALLERAALLPETEKDRALIGGFRFGARAEDARLLQLALEAQAYEVIRLTVDIAGGKRQGVLTLVFPVSEEPAIETPDDDPARFSEISPKPTLGTAVMQLDTEVWVALTRVQLPLARIGDLRIGDTLDLGVSGMENALVLSRDGHVLSRGRVGLSSGFRAVQLIGEKPKDVRLQRRDGDRLDRESFPFDATALKDTIDMPAFPGRVAGMSGYHGSRDLTADAREDPDRPAEIPGILDLVDLPDMSDLPELDGTAAHDPGKG